MPIICLSHAHVNQFCPQTRNVIGQPKPPLSTQGDVPLGPKLHQAYFGWVAASGFWKGVQSSPHLRLLLDSTVCQQEWTYDFEFRKQLIGNDPSLPQIGCAMLQQSSCSCLTNQIWSCLPILASQCLSRGSAKLPTEVKSWKYHLFNGALVFVGSKQV